MARLPLLCKGCGQALVVPESSSEPEIQPDPPRLVPVELKPETLKPVAPSRPTTASASSPVSPAVAMIESRLPPPERRSQNGPPDAHVKVEEPANGNDYLFERPDVLAELDADARDRELVAKPQPAPSIAPRPGNRKLLGLVVDLAVILVLLVAGVICGELLARQTTREVITDAGSAAKFPPVELLMWMAPTLLFLLIYALFISRGESLGGWLRRRAKSN